MQVLVDTSIWSLALRRSEARLNRTESERVAALRDLIEDGRARLIGPIRQELLSGIRESAQFEKLRGELRAFPDETLTTADYEQAAHWSNECQRRGIAGSGVDLLICSVSLVRRWQIFTADSDFQSYAKIIPIQISEL
jgi:predicted nucleic acid-binding protein